MRSYLVFVTVSRLFFEGHLFQKHNGLFSFTRFFHVKDPWGSPGTLSEVLTVDSQLLSYAIFHGVLVEDKIVATSRGS